MKVWALALAFIAVVGMANFAEAKGKHAHGLHGKIVSVGPDSFMIQTGGKKNPQTLIVKYTSNTTVTIDGVAGKVDSSHVGKRVTIVGASDGTTVNATSIAVTTVKHKKKTTAA